MQITTNFNEEFKQYNRMQKILGAAQGERTVIHFIREKDLNEKSDTHDRWIAKLTGHYDLNIHNTSIKDEIKELIYKIENLEPINGAERERLKYFLSKPLDA